MIFAYEIQTRSLDITKTKTMKTEIKTIIKNPNDKSQILIQREGETYTFIIDKNEFGLFDISTIDGCGYEDLICVKKSKKEAIQFVELF